MSEFFYSGERNALILVAMLKAYGIRRVIVSPGTTHINFVWNVQRDPFFEVFSAVDERHAAYMACGMAHESGEPVVLACTGATASRNYLPGLTEAYYRKLPVLAVTGMHAFSEVGHLVPQLLDRTQPPRDAVVHAYQCPVPHDDAEAGNCELELNRALIALRRHGGGPVHINLEMKSLADFSVKELPAVRKIAYVDMATKDWPEFPKGRVAVWVGAHQYFSESERDALERFALARNAVVFGDKTSNYEGAGWLDVSFLASQGVGRDARYREMQPELVIQIGEVSGDYPTRGMLSGHRLWRVSPDGELRDTLGALQAVFEMPEACFFSHYADEQPIGELTLAKQWQALDAQCRERIPELPFSNPWMAQQLIGRLPAGSRLHLAILNSLRSWNLFPLPSGVRAISNVGGFGIDGAVSTLLGASLGSPDKLFFAVVGDLAFFYDLNALGNRHLGKNLRILLVNNASGTEFHLYSHPAYRFGAEAGRFIAADGHFGNASRELVKHYVTDLGMKYLSADSKESFAEVVEEFLDENDRSVVLECFTIPKEESEAHRLINTVNPPPKTLKDEVVAVLPSGVKSVLKKVLR